MISSTKGNAFYWQQLCKVKITPIVQVVTSRHMETQIRTNFILWYASSDWLLRGQDFLVNTGQY